jgi:hypothetical protein
MPLSESLLCLIVEDFGFEKDYSIKCLEANRHNHITATYHLINKKNKRSGSMKDNVTIALEEKNKILRHPTDVKKDDKKVDLN